MILDVLRYTVIGDESAVEVANVGIRLGRRCAELLDRQLEWWIDVPVPLIYLCWWPWKPEASGEVRDRIIAARQQVIADHGYEALQLSDHVLVANPLAAVSDAALRGLVNIRQRVVDAPPASILSLSDQLVISNVPYEKYVEPEYGRFFGGPLNIEKLEASRDIEERLTDS